MMFTEEKVLASLSENEKRVYNYIKTKAENDANKTLKESMRKISGQLGISEATVHRAVQKLRSNGVIQIVPSREKTESNEIVFYGFPAPEEQVGDIFKMVGSLNSGIQRFETILNNVTKENERLLKENEELNELVGQLKAELNKAPAAQAGIDTTKIIQTQPLKDGTIAYIVKK
ncbi:MULTISPECIES: winged helix-turn-helix transcriptional regulator [Bacillus subtilis group]|uniref:Winged helix-turn-helix transcriptional regulator n=2 Tax=Bacillus subtilis group TaxID=653685 RepID=A0A8I1WCB4_BACIU|nr:MULTISPECIES: winged helix-turn-helix transcriptional regulator [Bacillus subtilis group]MBO3794195.1 winged helix-turn-helix transcriptional regulator [Bacillus subtilis]MED3627949.1 winged helix-turn-helix transcriptional regulator [Bacillus subtilis]WAT23487.1 winged helix-turn-helix transcriptional regulator [Bacillus halotolerans]